MNKVGQGDEEKWERFEIKEKGERKRGAAKSEWIKTDKSGVIKSGRFGAREQARLIKEGEGLGAVFKVQIVQQSALGRILPGYKGRKITAQIVLTPGERRQIQVSEGVILNVEIVKQLIDPEKRKQMKEQGVAEEKKVEQGMLGERKKILGDHAKKLSNDILAFTKYLDDKVKLSPGKQSPLVRPIGDLVFMRAKLTKLIKDYDSGALTDEGVEEKLNEFERDRDKIRASVSKIILRGPKKPSKS